VNPEGLTGGVVYYDGQFDDSRLLINLVATATEHGATVLNYSKVTALRKDWEGVVRELTWEDGETGKTFEATGKVIVNATGPFADSVRHLAEPSTAQLIVPSQGAHLVLDRSFLPGDTAIMVPHTSDGRVMFAIPWHGHTLVGTTDTPISESSLEPVPLDKEIEFMLETASLYLEKKPERADLLSVFAGIRPLVKSGHAGNTAALSRDHTIHIDKSGLVSIAGGKWTTYRNMAEDCVDQAATLGNLPDRECVTRNLKIHGWHADAPSFGALAFYGADAPAIQDMIFADPAMGQAIDSELPYCAAEVIWAVRNEMARTVEDILARRTRALFLNARAAMRMAARVAALLASELNRDAKWQSDQLEAFGRTAAGYCVN
jgi:glycerol-3-phosphate dehydrogenase